MDLRLFCGGALGTFSLREPECPRFVPPTTAATGYRVSGVSLERDCEIVVLCAFVVVMGVGGGWGWRWCMCVGGVVVCWWWWWWCGRDVMTMSRGGGGWGAGWGEVGRRDDCVVRSTDALH